MDNNFIKYLETLCDIETSVEVQERLLRSLELKVSSLETSRKSVLKPQRREIEISKAKYLQAMGYGAIFGAVMFFVVGILADALNLFYLPIEGSVFALFIIAGLILGACVDASRISREKAEAEDAYQNALKQYNQKEGDEDRRLQEVSLRKEILLAESREVQDKLTDTLQLREHAYSSGPIYQKYWNLPAISTFIDYFKSGICESLGGPTGAYAMYEHDSKLGKISTAVESIDSKMSVVIANQFMLSQSINACRAQLVTLQDGIERGNNAIVGEIISGNRLASISADKLNTLIQSSELVKWNTDRTAKELEYRRWLDNTGDYREHL